MLICMLQFVNELGCTISFSKVPTNSVLETTCGKIKEETWTELITPTIFKMLEACWCLLVVLWGRAISSWCVQQKTNETSQTG